jgi:hypothetical protein
MEEAKNPGNWNLGISNQATIKKRTQGWSTDKGKNRKAITRLKCRNGDRSQARGGQGSTEDFDEKMIKRLIF